MKKIIFLSSLALVFVVFAIAFFPIIPGRQNSVNVEGIVAGIYEGGVKDAVIVLQNDRKTYYINRGLEHGLTLPDLKTRLVGRKVLVSYAKHWSDARHITEVKLDDAVIYSELD